LADDPDKDGIWVINNDGTERIKLDIPFGAYRWCDDQTLFYIPLRESPQESMQLWQVDVKSNQSRPVTNPNTLPFSISNGDWTVSPDGRQIIFVNSVDQNIWLISLR
jgi:Tol biopolymer transport system component